MPVPPMPVPPCLCRRACAAVLEAGAPEAKFFGGDMRDADAIAAMMQAVMAWVGASRHSR